MASTTASSVIASHSSRHTKLKRILSYFSHVSFNTHLLISTFLRLLLIIYGQWHDGRSELPYTDIDYKVVTDGARHILEGNSPFARHTYRYSPLLAYILLPNVLMHGAYGKIIFSGFDILVALLIYTLVRAELKWQCRKAIQVLVNKFGKPHATKKANERYKETDEYNRPEKLACASACFWLYNPLTAVISTRGNGDSFSSFFVILTIYLLTRSEDAKSNCMRNWLIFGAGLTHGFAIHLRLYPLLFSLAFFMCLSEKYLHTPKEFIRQLLFPSGRQILLIFGTALSLCACTGLFYKLYSWEYIYEAYLYHFVRKDVRHNFSLYFLMQYLSSGDITTTSALEKLLILTPQLILLFYLSYSFGQFRQTLPFCIFSLAFVIVTFNSVVTSQYFIWYLALLPLCLNNLQVISFSKAIALFLLWLVTQGFWLLPAYLLEFKTWNTYYWIGAQSALFFLINNILLVRLIQSYSFTSFKINFKKLF